MTDVTTLLAGIKERATAAMDYPGHVTVEQSAADVPRLVAAIEEVDATPGLGDRLHGSPDFIDGWNAALEEVRARLVAALGGGE